MENIKSVFDTLNEINVNEHTEKKKELTYLSWAWAWAEVKKKYPLATYEIEKFENNLPYVFDEKTGYMVFTKVTIEGETHEMWLPVMDANNRAMLCEQYTVKTRNGEIVVQPATMFDVNKAIMRCLTKNLAMFGLGLYIYAGEDLPETASDEPKEVKPTNSPSVGDLREKARLIAKCTELGISLDRLATYKGKDKAQLTNEDLAQAIEMKEQRNARN